MESASQQELLDALKSSDPSRKEMAICEIGNREDPALLPPLFEILDDPSERIRWRTLQSIGKLGASGTDDRVLDLLKDSSSRVRGEAARVVGLAGRKELAPALAPLLEDANLQVRCRAIEGLGEIGDPGEGLAEQIVASLQDSDNRIRMHSALALGKCRHAPACSPLLDSLRDPSHNVRGLAAWALGNLGDERAIGALIEALEDEGESVRLYAYSALDAFGPKALPALEKARKHEDKSVRAVVDRLIEDISSDDGEDD